MLNRNQRQCVGPPALFAVILAALAFSAVGGCPEAEQLIGDALRNLPEPAGDSIFAIIAEELGLIRSLSILLLFALIGWRGYAIARRAPDTFGQLLAVGITTWIVTQAFINIGSTLAVTPLTGIPLPFISYGGSALATMLLAAGILLNISRWTDNSSK